MQSSLGFADKMGSVRYIECLLIEFLMSCHVNVLISNVCDICMVSIGKPRMRPANGMRNKNHVTYGTLFFRAQTVSLTLQGNQNGS